MAARLFLLLSAWCGAAVVASAQPANDDCAGALYLGAERAYCSFSGEFSNEGATVSGVPRAECFFDDETRDVWVSFRAVATEVSLRMVGALIRDGGGTIAFPELALYSGTCGALQEVACISDAFENNVIQVIADSIAPGELYYVRLGAREGGTGTFKLCIDQFDFVPEPSSDCVDGVLLCSKAPFTVPRIVGVGNDGTEVNGTCVQGESSSVWYKWTCDQPGDLGFVLTPSSPIDDLDFVVYELPDGIDGCDTKVVRRCEAAGENIGAPQRNWERCSGPTGMRPGEIDIEETPGCRASNNNFVLSLEMEAGKSYALMVNNFSDSGSGFSIEWSGSGTFLGPRPAFATTPEVGGQCDLTTFDFIDASRTTPGATVEYQWSFGSFASPPRHTGRTPPEVTYGSFGEKVATLRIQSSDGCVVTETQRLFVEPCCLPSDPLVAAAPAVTDPTCAGTPTGAFDVAIESGAPDYFFSVDGGPYLPEAERAGLFAGTYAVYVENVKGCRDTVEAVLTDPPPLGVDLGDDLTLAFGDSARVRALVDLPGDFDYTWTGLDSVRCVTAACDEVVVYGLRPGELSVGVSSGQGCTAVGRLRLEVRSERPLYAPTAFSPDGDDVNDRWTLFGPPVLASIDYLRVFDRWGNLVYAAEDLAPNDLASGWDGTFLGEDMNAGVFVWVAGITYVDGVTIETTGDLNLVR